MFYYFLATIQDLRVLILQRTCGHTFQQKSHIYFPFNKVKNSDMSEEGKELISIQPSPPHQVPRRRFF